MGEQAVGAGWQGQGEARQTWHQDRVDHYTQGYYDFVDVVDAPKPEAVLAFSVWYSNQGLGRIQSMPAFEAKAFETAIKDAAD